MFKHHDPGVVSAIGNLVEHFDWCRECRNNLLHAESYPSGLIPFPGGAPGLTKPLKKRGEPGYMALTLQELRGVAGRMQDGIEQCARIHFFLRHRGRPLEELDEKYRYYAKSLPSELPIPKPIAAAKRHGAPGPSGRSAYNLTSSS